MLVQEINRLHAPENWVLATDDNGLFGKIIKFIYAQHTVVKVMPVLKNWARRNLNFREIKLWLRREGWDYHARKLVFWLLRWKRGNRAERPQAAGQEKILFLVEVPGISGMESLTPLIQAMPADERMVIASDPRCQKELLEKYGIPSIPFDAQALGIKSPKLPAGFGKELRQRWEKLVAARKAMGPQMLFNQLDLWPIQPAYFRNLFFRRLPTALEHFHLAKALMQQYRVRAVVVATDTHYVGQLFARAAHSLNIYSLTIQHAMVIYPQIYLPVRTSQLAVMGDAVRDWLIQFGGSPDQLVVTGQPRFDVLVGTPKVSRQTLLAELELLPERKTWLLALEPLLSFWMRDLIFTALERLPQVQAIIRVHPFDSQIDYTKGLQYRPDLQSRVRVSRQHDVASALQACDVVITGRSTIGLEALLVKTPVITVWPPESTGWAIPPYLQEYLEQAPFLQVQDSGALLSAWDHLQNPEHSTVLEQLRQTIVRRYAHYAGQSTQRVIEVIRQQAWKENAGA
ncbi:MAG TPA: hypothetical protein PKM21_01935 [Anaerolineales bacterium]|nr:hypothetical protein [Anaerolineales bacterium]